MSVRGKLSIILTSFALVPVLIMAVIWPIADGAVINELYRSELQSTAEAAVSLLDDVITLSEEQVTLLTTSWNMRDYMSVMANPDSTPEDKARSSEILRENFLRYVTRVNLFNDVVLLDANGQIILACDPQIVGRDLSGMDYYLDHVNVNASEIHPDSYVFNGRVHDSLIQPENHDMRSLSLSHCIRNDDGSVRYVLVAYLNAEMLGRKVENVRFGKTGIAYVIDANSYILYHPDPHFVNLYTGENSIAQLIERYGNGEMPASGLLEDELMGIDRLFYYEIMPEFDLALILRQDYGDLSSKQGAAITISAAVCFILIALSFLTALWFSKKFARPFVWLHDLFKHEGTSSVPVAGGELAGIAAGYNDMLKKLDRLTKDLSKEKEKNDFTANHDRVTGLLNRPAFENEFKNKLKSTHSLGLIFLDIGQFKQINDTYGHIAGDGVLNETGRRIEASAAKFEICARAGNGQFVMAKAGAREEINRALEILTDDFKPSINTGKNKINVNVYLGAAVYPKDGMLIDMLMSNADIAMRCAKDAKYSTFMFFDAQMREKISRSNMVLDVLRECIRERELFLMYQPLFNLTTNTIVGFEAFMRIRNKRLGLLSPKEFIPIAESEPALISALGSHTIKEALWFIRRSIDRKGFNGYVSVNLSFKQLDAPNLVEDILSAIKETGVPADRLQLEITEIATAESMEKYAPVFDRLHSHGIFISLDDFGGMISSFYFLTRLPLDSLKVDQPFFSRVAEDKRVAQLNKTVLEMAKRFGMRVSAERVETQSDFEILKSVGYDIAQGFHFSLPLMEEAAIEVI